MDRQLTARRFIEAEPSAVFAVLRDPEGHVEIDASGMLQLAEGDPVATVGDRFTVHMDREALGDLPMGRYDVDVVIDRFEVDPHDRVVDRWHDPAPDRPHVRLRPRARRGRGTPRHLGHLDL